MRPALRWLLSSRGAGPERDYVTVIEAQEHLRRLWENERPILNLIFGTLRRGPNGALAPAACRARPMPLGADHGGAATLVLLMWPRSAQAQARERLPVVLL